MLISGKIIPTVGESLTRLWVCHLAYRLRIKVLLNLICLPSWTHLILIGLCYALWLSHSFKTCALPSSLLFHALFLSPIQGHSVASTIFWRDKEKIADLWEVNTV